MMYGSFETPAKVTMPAPRVANTCNGPAAAKLATDHGWAIFPAKIDGAQKKSHKSAKYSGGANWGATSDPVQVQRDFDKFKGALVGIATLESKLLVLDLDDKNGVNGVEWLSAEIKKHGEWPDTVEGLSPSGGWHVYFQYPDFDPKTCAGEVAPGVDVRGHGGMIIAPPSVKPGGTKGYVWKNAPGVYEVAPAPQWLLDQLPHHNARPKTPARPANVPPAPPSPAYGEKALRGEIATLLAAPPGTRNAALNNAALKLGRLVPDGHLSESLIIEQLTEAAARIGLDAVETGATIKSGMTKGMTEPRGPGGDALARLGTGPGAYIPAGMRHLPEISPAAVRLATRIAKGIRKQLPVLTVDPAVDALIIRDMIEGSFWSGAKMRMFLLNPDECLVQFVSTEAWKFLCKRFGSPVDANEIIKQLETDLGAPLAKKVESDARKAISASTAGGVVDYLKYENQRDSVEWAVDMFGTRSRLELRDDVARIVLTHRTLVASGKVDPACVADYRAHFPLLDEVLEYIVAARFALDRKKAFIWLFAASDWGKDFLMGALGNLGLVVETSVKEVEAAFEGKPSGMSATGFKRAFILAVNEFKTVKSEIKQLGSYLELSPKNQLRTRVQIYTKMFMSAESVASLVGENGVEDQFANRMSLIKGDEKLTDRALYKADQGRYFRSVQGYIAGELNRLIGEYQALGLEGAERRADTYLSAFIGRHGLDQHYERLSASYPTVADQAVVWIRTASSQKLASDGGYHYLTHATKVLDDYLSEHYTISEVGTLRRRKDEIMAHMSDDGRGNASHRIGGKVVKAVKLKS
jgi:hypothetical protein